MKHWNVLIAHVCEVYLISTACS